MLIPTRSFLVLGLSLLPLLAAGTASAVPISMDPGSVQVQTIFGIGQDFTLTFDGGDTSDNVLDFTVQGGGGVPFLPILPSVALAAIVFDDTSIIDSGDDVLGGVVSTLEISEDGGIAAALLVDIFSPSMESFYLQLADTPTTGTVYSLATTDPNRIRTIEDVLRNAIDSQELVFSVDGGGGGSDPGPAMPEPSAALVFGLGLLFTSQAIRRRA